jgi:hypothetical protein
MLPQPRKQRMAAVSECSDREAEPENTRAPPAMQRFAGSASHGPATTATPMRSLGPDSASSARSLRRRAWRASRWGADELYAVSGWPRRRRAPRGAAGPLVQKQGEPLQGGDGIEGPRARNHCTKACCEGVAWQPEGTASQAVLRQVTGAADEGEQHLCPFEGGEYVNFGEVVIAYLGIRSVEWQRATASQDPARNRCSG